MDEEPSFVRRWLPRAVAAVVLAGGVYLLWGWLYSSSLGYTRVGPRPSEGHKVLVLLHGYGASGDDFVPFAEQIAASLPDTTFLVAKGPYQVGLTGRAWLPGMSAHTHEELAARETTEVARTVALVWELVDYARKKGALCSDIYVGGFSQGGWIAAEVALQAPPDCSLGGVIVMSGGGVGLPHTPSANRPVMRVLVTQGTQDNVVGLATGKATAQHFAAGGDEVQWLQFDGPHTVAPAVREAVPRFLQGETVGTLVTAEP